MRILYLITKSEIGGAQVHVLDLMKYMIKGGHTVALMSYPGGWLVEEASRIGVQVYPNINFLNSFNPVKALRAIFKVKKALKLFVPDLVTFHSSGAGFLGRLAVRRKVPTIFTAHSWAFTDGAPFFRKKVGIIAEKIASKYTDKIICVSKFDYSLALKYHIAKEDKLVTVHNGVDIGEEVFVDKSRSKVKIISIGRLAYPKRPDLLVEAFRILPDEIRNKTEVLIVGSGPMRDRLSKKISQYKLEKSIRLAKGTKYENIRALLRDSEIFVLISLHEGLPLTILEAMSVGLPVIASDVGGISEEIDSKSGILVKNKKEEIAKTIALLVGDIKMRQSMGKRAREKVLESFSLKNFFSSTEKVYLDVLGGFKRAS